MVQTHNTFSLLAVSGRDICGHVTSSLQGKIKYYVWMKEETEYVLSSQREKDLKPSGQMKTNNCK